ncbi:hypothetical protein [Streptomyces atroolivaceus]
MEVPEERTETERDVELPDEERETRPETERREVDERDEERADACEPVRREVLPLPPPPLPPPLALPPPAMPVGGELTMPVGDTTGARPQVSQYSSPPPMSS